MSTATLNLRISPRRMLSEREAADYCGRTTKRFKAECRVPPVTFGNGDLRYDIRDLDGWIDAMKNGAPDEREDILSRLE